jgi:deoxyribodipyrimidine photo-lyase
VLLLKRGIPLKIWEELSATYRINTVYLNKDYEPYAIKRDNDVRQFLKKKGIEVQACKDQVIFEEKEITKADGSVYTVFTPYKKAWLGKLASRKFKLQNENGNFYARTPSPISPEQIGFRPSSVKIRPYNLSSIREYDKYRDYPAMDHTTHLGPFLRFGTVSIREIVNIAQAENQVFLDELIWREFFMQILFNFPHVVTGNFRRKYDNINWRNNEDDFRRWCNGETGYPIVDAGMRHLNETGFMHNRVRMITAGFLCKHLLIAWWSGEAYFASRLTDYELSSNNGNWQWAAGTGCDAAPYFRIFSPMQQQLKFDPFNEYIRRWVPDFDKSTYVKPIVDHQFARTRALEAYRAGMIK